MFSHRASVTVAQAVIQALVIGVIKSLLLQHPFQVPIDFGHEAKLGIALPHALDRRRPERLGRDVPGSLENIRQQQHRHVAAHAIALAGNP